MLQTGFHSAWRWTMVGGGKSCSVCPGPPIIPSRSPGRCRISLCQSPPWCETNSPSTNCPYPRIPIHLQGKSVRGRCANECVAHKVLIYNGLIAICSTNGNWSSKRYFARPWNSDHRRQKYPGQSIQCTKKHQQPRWVVYHGTGSLGSKYRKGLHFEIKKGSCSTTTGR